MSNLKYRRISFKKPKKTSAKIFSCWDRLNPGRPDYEAGTARIRLSHTEGMVHSELSVTSVEWRLHLFALVMYRSALSCQHAGSEPRMKYLGLAEGLLFWYGPMTKPLRGSVANTRTVCSTPNTIFLPLLTPGNEKLPTQIPGLCLIESSLGNRCFVRGITAVHFILMIVKQVNAPSIFFRTYPVRISTSLVIICFVIYFTTLSLRRIV
jgi:hypothetical protein